MKSCACLLKISLCGLGFLSFHLQAAGADALQFLNQDLDLGALTNGQTVAVTFVLTNRSDQTARLTDAEASCRCTSLQSFPEAIPPHSRRDVVWIFNSLRSTGEVTQTVEISSADGQTLIGQFSASVAPPASPVIPEAPTNAVSRAASTRVVAPHPTAQDPRQ
jgi:hypothetical protein